jgi:hypothetical protein
LKEKLNMNKLVLALAALMVLSPIAALAADAPDEAQTQTQMQSPADRTISDYYTLEVGGSGN